MEALRRLVLDASKQRLPSIVEMAAQLSGLAGAEAISSPIYEMDLHVENANVRIEGAAIDFHQVVQRTRDTSPAGHSTEQVVAGRSIIRDASTPQDPYQSQRTCET